MKKYYDKILFLLALIVVGAGAAMFYFKQPKGGVPQSAPLPPLMLNGSAYTATEKPEFKRDEHTWTAPPEQSDEETGWLYAVFTPPEIYWDSGNGWSAQPPGPAKAAPPFGVRLVSAKKELYRIQLKGTSGNGDKDDDIIFSDEESGLPFHLKVGEQDDTSKRHDVEVKDLVFDQVDKGHGVILKLAKVTILDTRTNDTITLIQGQEYAPTGNELYILQTDDPFPAKEWKVSKNGSDEEKVLTFPGSLEDYKGDITFKVVALDFAKPSVTVEKQFFPRVNKPVTVQRELTISSTPTPAPASDAAAAPADATAN
ncbi:MAG TPA: hypothetical protein VHC95_06565 [Opitutales bacterium]|nr:hypothetical protein [Opitutales bacterium]